MVRAGNGMRAARSARAGPLAALGHALASIQRRRDNKGVPRVFLVIWLALLPSGFTADLRVGLIGLDTSHATAFTKILNDPAAPDHVPGARVVAAFIGGSFDLEASHSRLAGYTQELSEKWAVRLYPTISDLCRDVDAVILTSVDGRAHLAQAIPVLLARKPLYLDKPLAASLRDAAAIFELAAVQGVPVWSASSLRYGRATQAVRGGSIGTVTNALTTSPCELNPTHPDLMWYGIHGCESLFTVMGSGCRSVRRGTNDDGSIEVTGVWIGGRTGVYREARGYGGRARGEKGEAAVGSFDGYAPLLAEVVKFFKTGVVPVAPAETLELFAFMEAADESKRRGGAAVTLEEIFRRAGVRGPPVTEPDP